MWLQIKKKCKSWDDLKGGSEHVDLDPVLGKVRSCSLNDRQSVNNINKL